MTYDQTLYPIDTILLVKLPFFTNVESNLIWKVLADWIQWYKWSNLCSARCIQMLCKKHSGVPNQSLQTESELAPCQSGILAHNTSVGSRSNWRLCPERHPTNSTQPQPLTTTGSPCEKPCNPPVDQPTQQHCIWGPGTKNKLFTLPPKPPRTPDHEELRNPPDLGGVRKMNNHDTWVEPLEATKWASYPGCKWPGEVAGSDLKGPNAARSWVYLVLPSFLVLWSQNDICRIMTHEHWYSSHFFAFYTNI